MKNIPLIFFLVFSSFSFAQVSQDKKYNIEILHQVDDVIWGQDFLSDGRILFTQKNGVLSIFDPKTKKTITVSGVPKVHTAGQAGLLDVRVHPKNGFIYLTYSEPVGESTSTTALARAKLAGNKLTDFKVLLSAKDPSQNDHHYGSRIEFDNKGHVFVTIGERGERDKVQKLNNHLGKVIRLNEDGTVPQDNPYVGDKNAMPEIWSYGIRSPQGLVQRPGTDELWMSEMGPKGGDEINLIKPKLNYGWPDVTHGKEYHGPKIGEGTQKKGVEQPIAYWVPSISPSGMAFWKNDIWLGNLSGEHLRRIELKGQKVTNQKEYFKELGWRFRSVRLGPDGQLYFSTDEGRLGKITPQ